VCWSLRLQYKEGRIIKNPQDIGNLFLSELQFESIEVVILAFLDSRNQLIRHEKMIWGTTNSAVVYKKDVARKALQWNAVGVIIGHNHPSGVSSPSQDDINMTIDLKKSLESLDIKLLDHILIANNSILSFRLQGLF
jgi:DNA repair protein RadC